MSFSIGAYSPFIDKGFLNDSQKKKTFQEAHTCPWLADFSEKLHLKRCRSRWLALSPNKLDRIAKLPVRYLQNRYQPLFWHHSFQPTNVHSRRLLASTMPDIDRILVHRKPVFDKILPKTRGNTSLRFRQYGQVEHHVQPHNRIPIERILCAKTQKNVGKINSSVFPR